jgi:hypothetical protein
MNIDGVTAERETKKEKILGIAMENSIKYGAIAFLAVGAATIAGAYKSKRFNEITSISAKASFPVMAAIGTFSFSYEMTVNDAQRHPERYGLGVSGAVVEEKKHNSLPIHHRMINYCYDHPFQLVSVIGLPFAGLILKEQLALKHLTLSQKIMHSRVLAQGGILTILLSTMAFREYMDRHGRFTSADEDQQPAKQL